MTIRHHEFQPPLQVNQENIEIAQRSAINEGYIIPPGTNNKDITPTGLLDKQLITVYKAGKNAVGKVTAIPYHDRSASFNVSERDVQYSLNMGKRTFPVNESSPAYFILSWESQGNAVISAAVVFTKGNERS